MEKKEILANLYAIKAGISAISVEKDKLSEKQLVLDQYITELEENKTKQTELKETISTEEVNYDNNIKYLEDVENDFSEGKEKIKKETKKRPKKYKSKRNLLVFWICIAVVAIICGIVAVSLLDNSDGDYYEFLIFGIIILVMAPLLYVKPLKEMKKDHQNHIANIKFDVENSYNSRIDGARLSAIQTHDVLHKLYNELSVLEKSQLAIIDNVKVAQNNYDQTAEIVLPVAQSIYNALLKQYGDFLDERDWEIVDLLIWYFQSNRVDTLKEALLHADEQRALDRIATAITRASENVSRTIKEELFKLSANLESCIWGLTREISYQAEQIITSNKETASNIARSNNEMAKMISDSINSSVSNINSSLNNLNSTATEQTEFFKKMRSDSSSLAKDVRYMMEAEQKYYR